MRAADPQVSYKLIVDAIDDADLKMKDGKLYSNAPRIDSTVYGLLRVNLDK